MPDSPARTAVSTTVASTAATAATAASAATSTAATTASATSVTVIGAGRLGRVIAPALREAGLDVHGPLSRGDVAPPSDIALLCVTDSAIPDAAEAARAHARLIGHVSGATGLDHVDFSIHPLQTFTGTESSDVFHGIGAAIDGRTPQARDAASHLARTLGAIPFAVTEEDRAAYHAAASLASNLILPVLDAAEHAALSAGIPEPRHLLAPLVQQTVENWLHLGGPAALTGPIPRGDEATLARQRIAIHQASPHLDHLFDSLVAAARGLIHDSPGPTTASPDSDEKTPA